MKFKTNLEDILDVLSKINKVFNAKDEIGKTLLIGALEDKQKILISATNNQGLIAYAYIPGQVITEGEAIITGKLFFDLIKKVPKKTPEIVFSTKSNRHSNKSLKLNIGKNEYEFATHNIDFPIPKTKFQWDFDINLEDFKLLLESAGWLFGAKLEEHIACEGVLFNFENNAFEVISTDLVKAAFCKIEYEEIKFNPTKVVIPNQVIKLITEQLKNYEKSVKLFIADEHIKIRLDNINFVSTLIMEPFPDPRKLYDANKKSYDALINRLELKKALERLLLFTDKIRQMVTIDLKRNRNIILTSNNITNKKRSVETLEEHWNNKPLFVGINCAKLLEICKKSKSKELLLTFRGATDAIEVREPDNSNTFYLLTALRTN